MALESDALSFVTEKLPFPATRQGVYNLLRRILSVRNVEKVVISAGDPIEVGWHRTMHDRLLIDAPVEDIDEVFARVDVQELVASVPGGMQGQLLYAMESLTVLGLVPTHICAYSSRNLLNNCDYTHAKELTQSEHAPYASFAGMYFVESVSVEEDTFVVLGSPTYGYELSHVAYAIKFAP